VIAYFRMEIIFFEKTSDLRKNLEMLQKKLEVRIEISGRKVTIEGDSVKEYEAMRVLEALQIGFPVKRALFLLDENFAFIKLNIKNLTNRKDLDVVRGRVIGKEGKTKRTIEDVADCFIAVSGNEVGIIADGESIEEAKTAVTNLIKGTKEANVYNFLERMNATKKKRGMLYIKKDLKKGDSKEDGD